MRIVEYAQVGLVWLHALAINYAPEYLGENEDGVKQDFPRVPLPNDAARLRSSAALGARLAGLLDPDQDVPSVTAGTIPHGLRAIGTLARHTPGQGPVDLRVTATWGYAGRDGIVMPGGGHVEPQGGYRPHLQRIAPPRTTEWTGCRSGSSAQA
jgi:hypothetical protein